MKNKNLLIGGAVLLGIILYLRSRKTSNQTKDLRIEDAGDLGMEEGSMDDSMGGSLDSYGYGAPTMGGGIPVMGGGALAQENGGGAVMVTSEPVVVAQPKKQPPKVFPNLFGKPQVSPKPKPANVMSVSQKPKPVTPTMSTGTLAGKNTGFQPLDSVSSGNTGGNNFLTFDGGVDRPSNLDFGGNIID